jgi:flagellar biosynthesis protein FlhG
MVINENLERKIIPIASGKGGVGKTIIAANLALELAANGKRTVVIDLDLGGSNLHTALGLKNIHLGIGNYLSSRGVKFKDIVVSTQYANLRFVPGDVLVSGLTNTQFSQKKKLLQNILDLDSDYIVLDLGSGSNYHVLDFFLISNSGFIVITGQAPSIVNGYCFLKNLLFRFLLRVFVSHKGITSYIKKLLREKKPNVFSSMEEVLAGIENIDLEAGKKARKYLAALHPKFIVNMALSPADLELAEKLRDLVRKNLSVEVECMGLIFRDGSVDRSVEEGKPLIISQGDSTAAKEIARITQKVLQSNNYPQMPLELDNYADTYELALIEAQNDFEELQSRGKEGEEEVDAGDLLAIISNQNMQINELRGTIRMLTLRNR